MLNSSFLQNMFSHTNKKSRCVLFAMLCEVEYTWLMLPSVSSIKSSSALHVV